MTDKERIQQLTEHVRRLEKRIAELEQVDTNADSASALRTAREIRRLGLHDGGKY